MNRWMLAGVWGVAIAGMISMCEAQEQEKPAEKPAAKDSGIPRLEPGNAEAKPLTVYEWTAESGATDEHDGFRYTWCLPKDFERGNSYDLVVVCHGTGLDYRWGSANLPAATFRPNNIVVCVDGPTEADDGTRLFLGTRKDAILFRDFVLEMGRKLPVDRIFFYGHSQGSFFVIYMATQFPGLTEGVVAHASGAWADTNLEGGIQSIPVVFMHGTADPVIPYAQSLGARDAFVAAEHPMVMVRRMNGYNHWPNAVRASESITWCSGMATTRGETALENVAELLRPRGKDEYQYECPLVFGGAYRILERFGKEVGKGGIEEIEEEQRAKATSLMAKIDGEGARHVAVLKKDVKTSGDLVLGLGEDEGAWLGHLVALREDFRGVPSVEAYVKEIGFDAAVAAQKEPAGKLLEIWYANRPDKYRFEVVGNTIGECFLVDTTPSDVGVHMAAIKAKAEELQLTEESLEKYGVVEAWTTARQKGYARYLKMCQEWKGE